MNPPVINPRLFERLSIYFATIIRIILNLLLIVAILAQLIGVAKTGVDLFGSLNQPARYILQQLLIDIVFILALAEITMTILGYLKDGQVHVKYIVDMVLIIMLNEVVSLWFTKPDLMLSASLMLIIGVLTAARIAITHFDTDTRKR